MDNITVTQCVVFIIFRRIHAMLLMCNVRLNEATRYLSAITIAT